jgi:two-component system sensor histidine kinase UhpB
MSLPIQMFHDPAPSAAAQHAALEPSRRPLGTSLKVRLSLLITVLIVLMMLAGGAFIVRQARQDIRAEEFSTMSLTGHFLDAQLAVLQDRGLGQGYAVHLFQLKELREVRHLAVSFYDREGRLLDSNEAQGERKPEAPAWFVWLVRRSALPMEASRRPVMFNGTAVGELVIQADPSYEIDEIWDTSSGLLSLLLLFSVLVNALVWWAVARALRPVEYILRALERSVDDNHSLTRRLMQMQEEEREYLARELHDEIGQCVTAIHADAVAVRNRGGAAVHDSAQSIVEAIGRIKQMVRSILQRLRPGTLEGVGLGAALRELTGAFRQRHPEISCSLKLALETSALQGELGITLYRIVQECLTNISRHAHARTVQIRLSQLPPAEGEPIARLELVVQDDGCGFDERIAGRGFGLMGIRERVRALGGSCRIEGASGRGTLIVAELPVTPATADTPATVTAA